MTVLLAGIQFVWTVELGYGTPYLLSLGLSKPMMTLVWMAGPLSGLIIQPVVGHLSDRCRSQLGRRRPYIIGGAVFVIASVIVIAYAKELASFIAQLYFNGGETQDSFVTRTAAILAVVGFYVLDFSINTSQACARAMALDIPPLDQQDLANAYAGRMLNLGSVSGYMMGFLDLPSLVPWKTNSQMQALCLVAIVVFITTVTWTCVSVKEIPATSVNEVEEDERNGWSAMFKGILNGLFKLPTPVQRICNVQFFAWIAWFPFLFFATTWVIEIMSRTGDASDPEFIDRATRIGSFALFLYSIASLGFSMVLPAFVDDQNNSQGGWKVSLTTMWRISLFCMGFVLLMTYFVADVYQAAALIIAMAFPWALAMWAPFALVGEYVTIATTRKRASSNDSGSGEEIQQNESPTSDGQLEAGTILGIHNMYVVLPQFVINGVSSLVFVWFGNEGSSDDGLHGSMARSVEYQAMGILLNNISGSSNGNEVVGWVLRIGGVSALIAAALTWFLYDRQMVRRFVAETP
ncbi:hypothetical protein GGI12_004981 [Dipsacomyces acuminosporus]|nr:hypothetical protein GGI12_004981 [Dipsacomyces acuminosporus]